MILISSIPAHMYIYDVICISHEAQTRNTLKQHSDTAIYWYQQS